MKEKMKLTKSKQFLADAIHASGKGWPDGANWAAQDSVIAFYCGGKPEYRKGGKVWICSGDDGNFLSAIAGVGKLPNWHQTVLSREEYFSAYPTEPDADGWIELNQQSKPKTGTIVDVRYVNGESDFGISAGGYAWTYTGGIGVKSYRLHNPVVKPEFCESVMRSIPEPEAKPNIEQLSAEYRNAKDYAERKQQEADAAKDDAEAKLAELVEAGRVHGLSVSPITEKQEPELVIADWRDLRVGDEVECLKVNITGDGYADHLIGCLGVVIDIEPPMKSRQPVRVEFSGGDVFWISEWKFIRRP